MYGNSTNYNKLPKPSPSPSIESLDHYTKRSNTSISDVSKIATYTPPSTAPTIPSLNDAITRKQLPQTKSRSSHSSRSSSNMNGSSFWGKPLNKRNKPDYQNQVVVRDLNGRDVTPVSLLSLKPTVLRQHTALADMSQPISHISPHVPDPHAELFPDSHSTFSLSRSFLGSETSRTSTSEAETVDDDDASSMTSSYLPQSPRSRAENAAGWERGDSRSESRNENASVPESREETPVSSPRPTVAPIFGKIEPKQTNLAAPTQPVSQPLTEAELEAPVTLFLSETPTVFLLDLVGNCVEKDTPQAQETLAINKKYDELLKQRVGNEGYVSKSMQTINNPPKTKDVQVNFPNSKEIGVMATQWDIFDSFHNEQEEDENEVKNTTEDQGTNTVSGLQSDTKGVDLRSLQEFDQEPGSWLEIDASFPDPYSTNTIATQTALPSPSTLINHFRVIERIITQNSFHEKQLTYRGLEDSTKSLTLSNGSNSSNDSSTIQNSDQIKLLWSFQYSPLTKGRVVTSISMNPANPDIIAVSYGTFTYSPKNTHTHTHTQAHTNPQSVLSPSGGGLVLCWSLHNLHYPFRVLKTGVGASSVAFSKSNPSLLGVGMHDGTVSVYDLRYGMGIGIDIEIDGINNNTANNGNESNQVGKRVLVAEGKHVDPVWDICWVHRGYDKGETLISVSTDGRVLEWNIKKGLEIQAELMRLRQVSTSKLQNNKPEAFISRQSGGFCLSFQPHPLPKGDLSIYLVGTEEGTIHKCSCSYTEQYLETYNGHTGPVYKVKWSPFHGSYFLSCSADWSICVWHQDYPTPILTLEGAPSSPINDISWCPFQASLFAAAAGKTFQLWDLAVSTLDPVFTLTLDFEISSVSFAPNAPVILVGDVNGTINVYRVPYTMPDMDFFTPPPINLNFPQYNNGTNSLSNSIHSNNSNNSNDTNNPKPTTKSTFKEFIAAMQDPNSTLFQQQSQILQQILNPNHMNENTSVQQQQPQQQHSTPNSPLSASSSSIQL